MLVISHGLDKVEILKNKKNTDFNLSTNLRNIKLELKSEIFPVDRSVLLTLYASIDSSFWFGGRSFAIVHIEGVADEIVLLSLNSFSLP